MPKIATALATLVLMLSNANAQELSQQYDTKNQAKAKGVELKISYPSGWVGKDGQGETMLQVIEGKSAGIPAILMISIKEFPNVSDLESTCSAKSERDWAEMFADRGTGKEVLSVEKIKMHGVYGSLVTATDQMQYKGRTVSAESQQMNLCNKNKMIYLLCGTGLQFRSLGG